MFSYVKEVYIRIYIYVDVCLFLFVCALQLQLQCMFICMFPSRLIHVSPSFFYFKFLCRPNMCNCVIYLSLNLFLFFLFFYVAYIYLLLICKKKIVKFKEIRSSPGSEQQKRVEGATFTSSYWHYSWYNWYI